MAAFTLSEPVDAAPNPRRAWICGRAPALCLAVSLSFPHAVSARAPFLPLIQELHFSRDGTYIFAETESEITVLSVQPLAMLFRIPGQDVRDAQFTPDSKQIVLIRSGFHVERWSIDDRRRVDEHDVPLNKCGTERLSPDGRHIGGVDQQGTLWLLDVSSGETVLQRKGYGTPVNAMLTSDSSYYSYIYVYTDPSIAQIDFSPDGRCFIATPALDWVDLGTYDEVVLWDLQTAKALRHAGDLSILRQISPLDYYASSRDYQNWPNLGYFVFATPDRLLIADMYWAKKGIVAARLVDFPSGKEIAKPKLPAGPLFRAADPAYVIVRPCGPPPPPERTRAVRPRALNTIPPNLRSAVAEISTGDAIISETPALDAFHNIYIAESSPGTVGIYERGKGLRSTIALKEK